MSDQGRTGREPSDADVTDVTVEALDLVVVAGSFRAASGREEDLASALARYVVLSRTEAGCRNVDLVASVTVPGRFMVWEKWESHEHQQRHLEGATTRRLAGEIRGLVAEEPELDLFDAVSVHDLR